jgi:hypothetical protein
MKIIFIFCLLTGNIIWNFKQLKWMLMGPSNPQKLALILLTSGGYSVGIIRKRTQAMEFSFFKWVINITDIYPLGKNNLLGHALQSQHLAPLKQVYHWSVSNSITHFPNISSDNILPQLCLCSTLQEVVSI